MSNNAYLLNTNILTSDRALLDYTVEQGDAEYACVATAANRIPVPWLSCFRAEDLRPTTICFSSCVQDVEMEVQVPCLPVASAIENLTDSFHIFYSLAKDKDIAQEYWAAAISALRVLPFPFITMDVLEVLLLNDPEKEAAALAAAVRNDARAHEFIKLVSAFQNDCKPYSRQEFFANQDLSHNGRIQNSSALEGGFFLTPQDQLPFSLEWTPTTPRPWWKVW